jgi:hypothetical protein
MAFSDLVAYAICGAIGGGLGAGLARLFARKRPLLAVVFYAGFTALGVSIAGQAIVPVLRDRRARREVHDAAVALFGAGRAADDYAARMMPILADPDLPKRLKTIGFQQTGPAVSTGRAGTGALAQIGYVGMARLSAQELETSMELRRLLAEKSLPICVGLWTGGLEPAELSKGLRALSEAQKQAWVDLALHATTLELHATAPAPPITDDALGKAWGALMQRLPAEKRAAFERATTAGTSARPDDACQAFKALATHVKDLAPADKDTMIRSVTCPFLISSGP